MISQNILKTSSLSSYLASYIVLSVPGFYFFKSIQFVYLFTVCESRIGIENIWIWHFNLRNINSLGSPVFVLKFHMCTIVALQFFLYGLCIFFSLFFTCSLLCSWFVKSEKRAHLVAKWNFIYFRMFFIVASFTSGKINQWHTVRKKRKIIFLHKLHVPFISNAHAYKR